MKLAEFEQIPETDKNEVTMREKALEAIESTALCALVALHMCDTDLVTVDVYPDGIVDIGSEESNETIWAQAVPRIGNIKDKYPGCNCDWCSDWNTDCGRYWSHDTAKGHICPWFEDDVNLFEEYDGDKDLFIAEMYGSHGIEDVTAMRGQLRKAVSALPRGYFDDEKKQGENHERVQIFGFCCSS